MSRTTSEGVTPPSSLLRAHVTIPSPPAPYGSRLVRQVFAGCCQPLLGVGSSRHYLCMSFTTCLDPYPGSPRGACTRFFPRGIGLPPVKKGRRSAAYPCSATSARSALSGVQSFLYVQARGFARHPDRSYRRAILPPWAAVTFTSEQNTIRHLLVHRIC